jgi:hypothetical protein
MDVAILWEKSIKLNTAVGIENFQLEIVASAASSNTKARYLRSWLGKVLLWTATCHAPLILKASGATTGLPRLRISIMQMVWASFPIDCHTECWNLQ